MAQLANVWRRVWKVTSSSFAVSTAFVTPGFYGENHAEAAERLLARTLEEMDRSGQLPPSP